MRNTIYASFSDPKLAERAAGALLDHGLAPSDLTVIQSHKWRHLSATEIAPAEVPTVVTMPPNYSGLTTGFPLIESPPMVGEGSEPESVLTASAGPDLQHQAEYGISTTTASDAAAGAISGVPWGVGIGALAALASLFIPGVGLVLGGGALAVAVAGFAATAGAGAAVGAMTGYLKDQGVESHVVASYEHAVTSGGAVLGATLPSGGVEEDVAWEVLTKYAGQNVTSYANKPYVS